MSHNARSFTVFPTAAGHGGIGWTNAGIAQFHLPMASPDAAERAMLRRFPGAIRSAPPPPVKAAIDAATRYFAGERIDFSAVALDLDVPDDFFRRIYASVRRLGWGETTTYGALAKQLGAGPEAARDVGQAMARNPVPLIIPCHRVLAAGGRLGGFSAPGGGATKLRMLEMEGVRLASSEPAQGSLNLDR
jgi:methylated-DNA-[protein]-cysteine S-methyltransferase